jgi:hypothetical protein
MLTQIIPASYQNEAKQIPIPGVASSIIPGSPEDIRIPVPPSGVVSPMPGSGLGTPAEPVTTFSLNGRARGESLVDGDVERKPDRKPENPLSRD